LRNLTTLLPLLVFGAGISLAADFATGLTAFQKGDYAIAVQEWRPIAEGGDAFVQYNMGLLSVDGHGVPQDYGEAVKWFRRSAEQGYAPAQHNLGAMYGAGQGVKRDYVLAYKWLNLCAAQGNSGCVSQRDLVAQKLKGSKLAQAQKLSSEFTPKKESGDKNESSKQ
jgi:uncharacterized protein